MDVTYNQLPQNFQLFPRNIEDNQATIRISGTVDEADQQEVVVRIFEGELDATNAGKCLGNAGTHSTDQQSLTYDDQGRASFSLALTIEAKLANYQLEICLRSENGEILERTVDDIVAGDVFLIQGQSNANAFQRSGSESASNNESEFIRSFGRRVTSFNTPDENGNGQSDDLDAIRDDLDWHLANSDAAQGAGAVGQWGIRLGRRIVDEFSIPVGLLNNAVSGTTIEQHQRDDINPNRLDDFHHGGIYGRLLWRAQQAGIADSARAMIWYQGESDHGNSAGHLAGFKSLYADWNDDYPGLEQIYIHQIRNVGTLCNAHDPLLREVQRQLVDDPDLPKARIMSTTAVAPQIDGCHFPYTGGYAKIGDNIFGLIARDLYGVAELLNVEPPNVDFAYFSGPARQEVTLVMRNQDDSLLWNNGTEQDFRFSDEALLALSGRVDLNRIILTLNQAASVGTSIDYLGHPGVNPPANDLRQDEWVTNGGGVGLLAFYELPIAIDQPDVQLTAPDTPLTVPRQSPVLFEVSVSDADGIAQMALFANQQSIFSQTYANRLTDITEQIEWVPTELGTFSMVAEAIDVGQVQNHTQVVTVTVINHTPSVAITQPAIVQPETSTTVVLGDEALLVETIATDPDGAIAALHLLVDGSIVQTLDVNGVDAPIDAPWTFSWLAASAGQYTLAIRAIDNDDAAADSAPLVVDVIAPTPISIPTFAPTATLAFKPTITPTFTPTIQPAPSMTPVATPVPTEGQSENSIFVPMIVGD